MKRLTTIIATTAMALLTTLGLGTAQADVITPTYTNFGTLAAATFGGSGIPNNAVAITTVAGVTLGLTAHQRYDNVAVTNDSAGTFFADVGPDAATGGNAVAGYGTWNVGFYFEDTDPNSGNTFSFFWDFDPAFDNDRSTHGALLNWPLPANPHQDSLNPGMAHLTWFASVLPMPGAFDPNVEGWYTFSSLSHNPEGRLIGESAIRVQVGNPEVPGVPEPEVAYMAGLGLIGFVYNKRRRKTVKAGK